MGNGRWCRTASAVLALLLTWAIALPGSAADAPAGSVDWVGGYVQGIGYGTAKPTGNRVGDRIAALRAAHVMAQRALAEAIYGVRVDGAALVRDAARRYVVESSVQGVVRGARKVSEKVTWDGNVPAAMVELRACLVPDGPECRAGASIVEIVAAARAGEPAHVPSNAFAVNAVYSDAAPAGLGDAARAEPGTAAGAAGLPRVSYDSARPVTGLLLRIEGARFERQLFPVVVARGAAGALLTVYSAKSVKPETVRTRGVARFADTLEQALANPLVGDNPLVIAIQEVTRENMLVVRADGARAVRETTRFGNDYLADAKVVIAGRPSPAAR